MTGTVVRRRRCQELLLAAVILTLCYPVGMLMTMGLLQGYGLLLWMLGGPALLLVAWLMAAAVLADGRRPRAASPAVGACRAAAIGLAVALAVPAVLALLAATASILG